MSFTTSNNFVAISNGNNNTNIIATSNSDNFIAAIGGNKGPITGAKYFKGATPGTIKKPSAGVASMKTTAGFNGLKVLMCRLASEVPPWGTIYSWLLSQELLTPLRLGLLRPSNRLEG